MAEFVFWSSCTALAYIFFGYPFLLAVLGYVARKPLAPRRSVQPHVSLIISAYNEEQIIERKIRNSLALDYPQNKLEIMIVSDASTDETDNLVGRFSAQGIVLKRMPTRQGKTAGLNAVVPLAQGAIIVFSDANALYAQDSIQNLVRNFADPAIGCVTGNSCYVDFEESTVGKNENIYWGYDRFLKTQESQVGSMIGSDGAMFAIRRELFLPLRVEDINDFVTPLQIVRLGHRNIFEPEALCYESAMSQFAQEFRRKVRIVNRSWQGLFRERALLNPWRYGWFSVALISHKLLRWLTPGFLICLLSSSLFLSWDLYSRLMLVAVQVVFYLFGGLGVLLDGRGIRNRWVSFPAYFLIVNAACALGIVKGIFGTAVSTWEPERPLSVS